MSRGIAVHVVAGILFVGVGTLDAQVSILRPAVVEARDTLTTTGLLATLDDASGPENDMPEPGVLLGLDCVAGIEGDVGVTIAIAPLIHVDDPNDNVEGQNSQMSRRAASDSPHAKAGTTRRWFAGAMVRVLESVVRGVVDAGGK